MGGGKVKWVEPNARVICGYSEREYLQSHVI